MKATGRVQQQSESGLQAAGLRRRRPSPQAVQTHRAWSTVIGCDSKRGDTGWSCPTARGVGGWLAVLATQSVSYKGGNRTGRRTQQPTTQTVILKETEGVATQTQGQEEWPLHTTEDFSYVRLAFLLVANANADI